jgi:hypothetical protein
MNRPASDSANDTFSFISYELDRYIYISYMLSFAMLLYSAVVVFIYRSFWLSEACILFVFTLINHAIAIDSRAKLNRLGTGIGTESSPLLRPRSTIAERLIDLIFLGAFVLTIVHVVSMFRWYFSIVMWKYRFIAALVETLCLFFEIPLMVVIGWWTLKERRGAFNAIRSYDLPQ